MVLVCQTHKPLFYALGTFFVHALELVSQFLFSQGLLLFLWGELSCYKSVCNFLFRSYSHLIMSGGLFLFLPFQPWSMSKFPHNIGTQTRTQRKRKRERESAHVNYVSLFENWISAIRQCVDIGASDLRSKLF